MKKIILLVMLVLTATLPCQLWAAPSALLFQTDFGLKDGAVSAMKGVAFSVSPDVRIFDITHEIPAFNIWEGAYRLKEIAPYWPAGTVFVSVIDPGVGTERKSIVLKTRTGQYFVSPDNGTLTLIAEDLGIVEIREIDEVKYRLPGSEKSYTFHGRDLYAYAGVQLASGKITFEEVGPVIDPQKLVLIQYQQATFDGTALLGTVPVLDIQFGNVWTNIDENTFKQLGVQKGEKLSVQIKNVEGVVFEEVIPYVNTFGDVPEGEMLAYLNSQLCLSFAINMGNFSETYGVYSGPEWHVKVTKAK